MSVLQVVACSESPPPRPDSLRSVGNRAVARVRRASRRARPLVVRRRMTVRRGIWLECIRARGRHGAHVLGALAAPSSAQITTGTVAGSVKDEQGLAVPGASVTLVSEARGTRMAPVVTNGTGDFVVPNVTPDTYTVEVAMTGFRIDPPPGRRGQRRRPHQRRRLDAVARRHVRDRHGEVGSAADSIAERRTLVSRHDRGSREPADRHRPELRDVHVVDTRRRRSDDETRRRRPEQHHDGRRLHDGHRQQRTVAADESRGDCRSEGAGGGLSGGVRAIERAADHGRHQERDQSLPRIGRTTSCGTPTGTRTAG